jgi:D-alanine--D-alanine ligase
MFKKTAKKTIAVMCGGPSLERGISLNSARSALDHLESEQIEILPIYFDAQRRPYRVSKAQLYSNTPSDFDFKLKQTATPLSERTLLRLLRTADITFPIMHGPFGEDGGVQSFLEKHRLPFVGSGSVACKKAFDKFDANTFIGKQGFFTLPSVVLKIYGDDHKKIIDVFFKKHAIKRAIVKPASGGSSIGVFSVTTPAQALEKVRLLFSKRMDTRIVLEPFAEGVEFTMIILENRFGLPVALTPTEIETDYTENQIFDFRRKYLPTRQVTWHCPPRFENRVIEKIQAQGEQLFALFGMRDFARFDGWVLPDGNIWFCDFNPISGMEQNSFLFQQSSRVGLTHGDVLKHIVSRAAVRNDVSLVFAPQEKNQSSRKKIHIIMGGSNSERQVSLMSGTNVWLKLRKSRTYAPHPYILDAKGSVWKVPYQLCLNHTVEEITENCERYQEAKARLDVFEERARLRLGLFGPKDKRDFFEPERITLRTFMDDSEFVFIALHGGDGENGVLQKSLDQAGITYNGPGERVSRLCMDKWETSKYIHALNIAGLDAIPGKAIETRELLGLKGTALRNFWRKLRKELQAETIIVKPKADGCTTGIVHLFSSNDLAKYIAIVTGGAGSVSRGTFKGQLDIIEMPTQCPEGFLFEKFIETDQLRVKDNQLKHTERSGWIEITIGVISRGASLHAFNPSITVAEGEVLSVEEKFQGGTGVNITPPPANIMKPKLVDLIKKRIEQLATDIGIEGYSRIDAFVNVRNGALRIIEINTLPGLTPSTVFYHQALAEKPPMYPDALLEMLVKNKGF